MSSAVGLQCWNCGESIDDIPLPISRHANCQKCFEVLHCCRLCQHYEKGRPGDCLEDLADPPGNKETANFCSYFKPKPNAFCATGQNNDNARSKLDALFGGEDSADSEIDEQEDILSQYKSSSSHNPLDDLFNDD